MNKVTFKFKPLQFVTVTLFGLMYEARVIRCIWENGGKLYDCDLWTDGSPRRREFYEDELTISKRNL